MTPYTTGDGQTIALGDLIATGGEGSVYQVANRPSMAVKIYHPQLQQVRSPKIAAMVDQAMSKRTALVAFPRQLVKSGDGRTIGFTMSRIVDHRIVFQLHNPASRRTHFAAADNAFLIRAATNVARAIASVHYAGCVVGDLNQSGVLVSRQAIVALIDADSFQVEAAGRRFLCGVGIEDYLAPELSGLKLDETVRTRNHDAFALATLIFQLLSLGRQPFSGMGGPPDRGLGDAIRAGDFAYSRQGRTRLSPPPGAIRLDDFPPVIAAAFESAFAPVGRIGLRPRPMQWVDLLERYERALVSCSVRLRHRFASTHGACPWCRIEAETSRDPF